MEGGKGGIYQCGIRIQHLPRLAHDTHFGSDTKPGVDKPPGHIYPPSWEICARTHNPPRTTMVVETGVRTLWMLHVAKLKQRAD